MTTPPAAPPDSAGGGAARVRWMEVLLADLVGFGVLALISLLTGLGINQMRHQPLPLVYHAKEERLRAAVARLSVRVPQASLPARVLPPREIGLEEFQAFVARKGTVIDARSPYFYGQGHVPGAVNLPRESFETDYARLGSRLSAHKADLVAIYCSGADCPDSKLMADALGALGFRQLLVYGEGWEEWSQSGLPQEK